jgi:small subunit ribosomal protein S6
MRRYEVVFIVHPDLTDEEIKAVSDRYGELIVAQKGTVIKTEDWGRRKLAYDIKKQSKGAYALIDFYGPGNMIREIERNFNIDDKILKFLTVKIKDPFDPALLEQEKEEEIQQESLISPEEMDEGSEKSVEVPEKSEAEEEGE